MTPPITIDYRLVSETKQVEKRLLEAKIDVKSYEYGADREQWFVEWHNAMIVICVEHLSESAWLEVLGNIESNHFQDFHKLLFCH